MNQASIETAAAAAASHACPPAVGFSAAERAGVLACSLGNLVQTRSMSQALGSVWPDPENITLPNSACGQSPWPLVACREPHVSRKSKTCPIDFRYTPECIEAFTEGASTEATADLCNQMGASVDEATKQDDPNNSGSCRLEAGGCACTISTTQDISSMDSYRQEGNTLIIDAVEVEYCVSGSDSTLQDEYATTRLTR